MAKTDNDRKFPGESGPRPDHAAFKRKEAAERQEAYDKLTVNEKLARLDAMFGKEKGATNERARLAKTLHVAVKPDTVVEQKVEASSTEEKPRVKAKQRRKQESK